MTDSTPSAVLDLDAPAFGRSPRSDAPRVLVVEDDPDSARRASRALFAMGLRAVVVASGAGALERLARDAGPFAVACIDSRLRDVASAQVLDEARRLRPGMHVLLTSDAVGDVLTSDRVVLCRPFTADEFRRAFDAALLDEPRAIDPACIRGADAVWPDEQVVRMSA